MLSKFVFGKNLLISQLIFSTVPLSLLQYGRAKYDFVLRRLLIFLCWLNSQPLSYVILITLFANSINAVTINLVIVFAVFETVFLICTYLETRSTTTVKQGNVSPLFLFT